MDLAKVLKEYDLTPEEAYKQGLGIALDLCSEEFQIQEMRLNGHRVKYIKNPSEQVQLAAVRQNWISISFLKNPPKKVQFEIMEMLKADWTRVSYIDNPCEEIQKQTMEQGTYAIERIRNPSENTIRLWIVQKILNE